MPDMAQNYEEWVAYQKLKWRVQRAERKRKRMSGISLQTAVATAAPAAQTQARPVGRRSLRMLALRQSAFRDCRG